MAAVAKGMELKLQITMLQHQQSQDGDAEVERAVKAYGKHLSGEVVDLERKRRRAQQRWDGFQAVGPGMRELAKRYADTCKEIEDVGAEIERLEDR